MFFVTHFVETVFFGLTGPQKFYRGESLGPFISLEKMRPADLIRRFHYRIPTRPWKNRSEMQKVKIYTPKQTGSVMGTTPNPNKKKSNRETPHDIAGRNMNPPWCFQKRSEVGTLHTRRKRMQRYTFEAPCAIAATLLI